MSNDSKGGMSFDNDPGKLNQDGEDLDFTFSDIPVLGSDKDSRSSFSFDASEKDPALASFEALLAEQPKDDDSEDERTSDDLSDTAEDLSDAVTATQSQIEIERAKAIRRSKRRKKKIILISIIASGVALLAGLVFVVVLLFRTPKPDRKALTPKELAALKAAEKKKELDALMSKAESFLDNGDADKALELYRKVLEDDDARSAAHYGVGRCLDMSGKHADAVREFERAVELVPETTAPYIKLSKAYIRKNDKPKAKSVLKSGAAKFPQDHDLLLALANLCCEMDDPETALECFKKLDTGKLDLDEITRYVNLLRYESKDDAKKLAISGARKFKNMNLYLLATELAKDDEDRLTILLDAEKELGNDAKNLNEMFFKIAALYFTLDQPDKAKEYLRKIDVGTLDEASLKRIFEMAEKLAGESGGSFVEFLEIKKESGEGGGGAKKGKDKFPRLLDFLVHMLKNAPGKMGIQLLILRQVEKTLPVDKVLELYGDLWLNTRSEFDKSGKDNGAGSELRKRFATVSFLRAKALQDASIIPSALKYYAKAIDLEPDFYEALLTLGKLHLTSRRPEKAARVLKRCVKLRPKALLPRRLLAESRILSGDGRSAIEDFAKFLDLTKMSKARATLILAEEAMGLSEPKFLDECLAKLKSIPEMADEYKKLSAKRKLLFGGATISDFAGARKGLFRQYKMIYLLSKGELMKVLTMRTPREEFPDFWKIYVMLEKKIKKRKKYQPPVSGKDDKKKAPTASAGKKDILELLYEKTRKSANIPKKMAAAIWNGKRTLESTAEIEPLVPTDQLALYHFLRAVEFKHAGQRTKARIALRKAMKAPRSVYRPLIEYAYKQTLVVKKRRRRR